MLRSVLPFGTVPKRNGGYCSCGFWNCGETCRQEETVIDRCPPLRRVIVTFQSQMLWDSVLWSHTSLMEKKRHLNPSAASFQWHLPPSWGGNETASISPSATPIKAPDLTSNWGSLWFLLQLECVCSCYPVDLLLGRFTYLNVQLGSQTLSPKISRLLYLLLSCSQKLASALIPLLLAVLCEFN